MRDGQRYAAPASPTRNRRQMAATSPALVA